MSFAAKLRAFHLAWLSRPAGERILYREIRARKALKIVEFGVGDLRRALRMIATARLTAPGANVHYAGIDEFELRSSGNRLPLKSAWQTLRQTGSKIRLVPGDPYAALARTANDLANADLVLIAADVDRAALVRAAQYLPRLVTSRTRLFLEAADSKGRRRYAPGTLAALIPQTTAIRRAA